MARRRKTIHLGGTHIQHGVDARKYMKDVRRFLTWTRDDVLKHRCQGALANLLAAARAEGRLAEAKAGSGRRITGTKPLRSAEKRFFKTCIIR